MNMGILSCFAYYNANTKSSIYKRNKTIIEKYLFNEKYAIKNSNFNYTNFFQKIQ